MDREGVCLCARACWASCEFQAQKQQHCDRRQSEGRQRKRFHIDKQPLCHFSSRLRLLLARYALQGVPGCVGAIARLRRKLGWQGDEVGEEEIAPLT